MGDICIFQNFQEDARLSMENYSSGLYMALKNCPNGCNDVQLYRPTIPALAKILLGTGVWGMRFYRYMLYPVLALTRSCRINHIGEHGYAHLIPFVKGKRVITVMDLIPMLAWRGEIDGMKYPVRPRLLEYSLAFLGKADKIITISHATKRDLMRIVGIQDSKIEVIYPGLDHGLFRNLKQERSALAESLGIKLRFERYLLITGREPYKNHLVTIRALAMLHSLDPGRYGMLHIARSFPELEEEKAKYGVVDLVEELGTIRRELLPVAYNLADCLLFPSVYEGFGWPPIEAMACGTPVVASRAGALEEVVGELDTIVEPHDVDGISNMVRRLDLDASFREEQIERGLEIAGRYTWERTARETCKVYSELLEEAGRG